MIAVLGERHPIGSHFLCLSQVSLIIVPFASLETEHSIACHTHDGLDGKVGIMSQMTCEVVRAELVLRVLSVLYEIVGPLRERPPVAVCPVGIAVYVGDSGSQDDDVGTLFDRHVAAKAAVGIRLCDGIDLPVGMWISTQVVGSEVESPFAALAIIEDGSAHTLHQLCVVE